MMQQSITISPPNSLIFVMDHAAGELPEDMGGKLVASTASCVAVGTLAEFDGETTITLADTFDVAALHIAFEGTLHTPNGEVSISNTRNEQLLTGKAWTPSTNVRIFVNDDSEPDQIVVLLSAA